MAELFDGLQRVALDALAVIMVWRLIGRLSNQRRPLTRRAWGVES